MNSVYFMYLMSFFQSFLYAYFFSEYLYCEDKRKRFIKIVCFFTFIVHPITIVLYNNILLKGLLTIFIIVLSICFFFKENSIFRRFIAILLCLLSVSFSELIIDVLFYLVHGYIDFPSVSILEYLGWLFTNCLLCFYIMKFILKIIEFNKIASLKEKELCIAIFFSHCILIYATAIEIVEQANEAKIVDNFFFIIFLFFVFGIHLLIIYQYIQYKYEKTKKLTFYHLQREYKQQLESYLESENKEIRYLRHDIINFLESQKGR